MHSGWQEVVADCEEKECHVYSSRFGAKAQEAGECSDTKAQQVYGLLNAVTSLHLKLDSPEEPFVPMMVFHDRRTAIVDDFNESHLNLFKETVSDITDAELRARIADVLWLRKRDYRMGEIAVTLPTTPASTLVPFSIVETRETSAFLLRK